MHAVKYTCEICGQLFVSKESFYAHCTAHVSKGKRADLAENFICDICNKNFKTKGSIRNHMLLHTGENSFSSLFFLSININSFEMKCAQTNSTMCVSNADGNSSRKAI